MAITQGSYGQSMDYTVDMVFCIDATGSMEDFSGKQTKIINMVKQNAISFYGDFNNIMAEKGKKVRQLRVRIVAFRDYIADGEHAMMVTDFFQLPQQAAEFEACINSIHADGGGDIPEDGLEALAYAIKSKWTNEGMFRRHIIMLWTDADAHALGFGSGSQYYPKGMPSDLDELSDWWDEMDCRSKRLILFAPDDGNWQYISDNWDLTMHIPTSTNTVLTSNTYEMVINALV